MKFSSNYVIFWARKRSNSCWANLIFSCWKKCWKVSNCVCYTYKDYNKEKHRLNEAGQYTVIFSSANAHNLLFVLEVQRQRRSHDWLECIWDDMQSSLAFCDGRNSPINTKEITLGCSYGKKRASVTFLSVWILHLQHTFSVIPSVKQHFLWDMVTVGLGPWYFLRETEACMSNKKNQ